LEKVSRLIRATAAAAAAAIPSASHLIWRRVINARTGTTVVSAMTSLIHRLHAADCRHRTDCMHNFNCRKAAEDLKPGCLVSLIS